MNVRSPCSYMFHLISTLRHFSHVWCNCWEIDIELWVRIKRKIENRCNVDLSGHGWYFNMVIKQWEIVIRHHFLSLSFSDNYVYSCWPIFSTFWHTFPAIRKLWRHVETFISLTYQPVFVYRLPRNLWKWQNGSKFRPNFLQNEVRVKIYNFHFCSIVAKFIPMNMHVCLCKWPQGQLINLSTANNWRDFVGTFLLAKFCRRSLRRSFWVSTVCSVSMRRSLRRRTGEFWFVLIFLFKHIHRNLTTNFTMHQGTKPKKIHQAAHQIYSFKSLSHNLDYQFVGPVFWYNAFQSGSRPRLQV